MRYEFGEGGGGAYIGRDLYMEGLIFGILQYLVYVIKLLLLHKFAFPVSTILLMVMTMMKTLSSLFFFRFSERTACAH